MTTDQHAELMRYARTIAEMEKATGHTHSGDAYAHALGRCNGLAKLMLATLEALKPERVRVLATDLPLPRHVERDAYQDQRPIVFGANRR